VYFVATSHDEFAEPEWLFPAGSIVLDPWRFVPPQDDVEVVPIGVGASPDERAGFLRQLATASSTNGAGSPKDAAARLRA
jgi:hypothetical protein